MPIYEYSCGSCRDRQERLLPLKDYRTEQFCGKCGGTLNKIISAPMVVGDYSGYECPVSGKWVEGRRQHEENLKRTGCRLLEPGETERVKQNRRREDAELDAAVDETVEKFVDALSPEKKEQLANEIAAGADVAITRQSVGDV
jgi:putative FmdB family regulatory protein